MTVNFDKVKETALSHFQELSPYLPAIFFSGGFVFDMATLGRIDNMMNIVSHGGFLFCTLGLLISQIIGAQPGESAGKMSEFFFKYRNDAIHFMLGALLNAFVIFYFKSGSIINTFLLVAALFILLAMNEMEFFKRKGPTLKVVLFTISLSSFFIYLLPVLFGRTGGEIFLASQVCALLVILATWQILMHLNIDFPRVKSYFLTPSISVILVFSILYALHIIPPVPLSLKQIGIYHNIEKTDGKFTLSRLTPAWKFWSQGDQDFVAREGDRIYLFSRIFAPGGFRGKLYFHFQVKNKKNKWQTTDKIPLTIVGGRDEGFRGYAYKKNYSAGKWRALVETTEGREVGRINFRLSKSTETSEREFIREYY